MSDDIKDDNTPEDKKDKPLKGFANPKNRKNINKRGRPRASTSKVPKAKEIEDMVLKGDKEATALMMKFIREDSASDATRLKAAIKIKDEATRIRELRAAAEEAFDRECEQEEKATGTNGGGSKPTSNVRFLNTKFNKKDEEKEDDED